MQRIKEHLVEAQKVLNTFLSDESNIEKIQKAGNIMVEAINNGNKIFSCGNGGSMSDAMHFAEELTGNYRKKRKALPAIAIADPTHISCVANDFGYDKIFSRSIEALGNKGDVLLAISTSGNSQNVINAINVSKEKGLKVIGLTAKTGGKMAGLCDIEIRAPKSEYSDRAQEIHIKVIHVLIDYIEKNI
ncbi:MAG: D-sedoheptulose 7-phosphate isomerase [Bacteroidota bacterium]|nr:D-sedoheptulose 7-phosphate isomerase [Bacteroidota bacterium]